jgi:hypothetical protein
MQVTPSRPGTLSIDQVRSDITGQVIGPDDTGYDDARQVFVGSIDRRPAVIVRVADAADVARVVALAQETQLPLLVRGGGHSNAGHGVVDDGIVLDLGAMKALDIDAKARTAWAEAGLTAAEYTTATGAHGLATGFGDTGSVGIGGLTLGGGVGFLVRKHGLTIDNLLAADVVTADGELRHVDEQHDPDLFWAIRGGGGNFGVATRFHYRLNEVATVVGGMLILPATPDVIAGFIAEAAAAPEELSTIANVMPCPPLPFVPEDQHGKLVVFGILVYAGQIDAGQAVLGRFRKLAPPVADMTRPMPYPEIYPPDDPNYRPVSAVRTMFLDAVDRDVAETIVEHLDASDAPMRVAQLRVLGGAMARVPADATAFAHRSSRIMANLAAVCAVPDQKARHEAWVSTFADAVRQGDHGAYVNFLGDEGQSRIHEAYPDATWERLAEVKSRYDPTNVFRSNQNIPPGAGRGGR